LAVRSKTLYFDQLPESAGDVTLYEVPANTRVIIKSIRLVNPNTAGQIQCTVTAVDILATLDTNHFWIRNRVLDPLEVVYMDLWQVLPYPGTITGRTAATGINPAQLWISGAELAL
jgi:hypothetical protein